MHFKHPSGSLKRGIDRNHSDKCERFAVVEDRKGASRSMERALLALIIIKLLRPVLSYFETSLRPIKKIVIGLRLEIPRENTTERVRIR